jgi:DNA-binding response OmpR family regulator
MLVDDDRVTVTLMQTLLSLDGFDVATAHRGAEVLDVAEQEKPDIFLVDFHLPDMSGVQVITNVRNNPHFATTPIVMVSGMNVEIEAKRAGANLFLVKPFDPNSLSKMLMTLLGK